jgi:hypothetical protein
MVKKSPLINLMTKYYIRMFLTKGNGINDNLQAAVPLVLMVIAVGIIIVELVFML